MTLLLSPQAKTKKVLDIWVKGSTFPTNQLSRLSDIVEGKKKGAYRIQLCSLSTSLPVQFLLALFMSINPVMQKTELELICCQTQKPLNP